MPAKIMNSLAAPLSLAALSLCALPHAAALALQASSFLRLAALTALAVIAPVALLACALDAPAPAPPTPLPPFTVTPAPLNPAAHGELGVKHHPFQEAIWMTGQPIEYNLRAAKLVVRAKLLGVEELIETPSQRDDGLYRAHMAFKFDVLEYLRGSGASVIWGVVELPGALGDSEEAARAGYNHYIQKRDASWDGDEAVVMLYKGFDEDNGSHHWLGTFYPWVLSYPLKDTIIEDPLESYSPHVYGSWLPLLSSNNGVSGSSGAQEFLYWKPPYVTVNVKDGVVGASTTNGLEASLETFTLSSLREMSAQPPEEMKRRYWATSVALFTWPENLAEGTRVAATAHAVLTATAIAATPTATAAHIATVTPTPTATATPAPVSDAPPTPTPTTTPTPEPTPPSSASGE